MLGQTGEYLILSGQTLNLKPVLATSWTSNSKADVWTYKIRQGVKFHNGQPMTADDVVYTYQLQTNPKGGSAALSAFAGVLLPAGVVKVDDFTVAFHLEAPNGNFPYLTSSDNYNMIILPKGYDPTKWESTFIGTGPFKLGSYTPKSGATFTRNESYWGTKALPSQTQFTFYATQPPSVVAMTGGTIDVLGQFSTAGGEASGRRSRSASTGRRSCSRCSRASPTSATTARSRPCSRPPTPASRSARRTSPRPSPCSPRPGTPQGSAPSWPPRTSRRSPTTPRSWPSPPRPSA
jgi:peptide/nickel transport system substrate-binding protein